MKRGIFSTACRIVSILMTLAIISLIIFNVVLYFLQDSIIFTISKLKPHMHYGKPSNSESIIFPMEDGYKYECWLVKTSGNYKDYPVILYILGNGSFKEDYVSLYEEFVSELNVNMLACSTRGSGTNQGKPSEELLYSDSQIYLNYLNEKFKYVFIHGRSMGGAVAIDLAYKNPDMLTGLIVENTFLSLKTMAQHAHPYMFFFTINYDWIIRSKMENGRKIRSIATPTLFNVSLKDKKVPPEHTQHLYDLSGSPYKYMFMSKDGTHQNVMENDEIRFFNSYRDFIKLCLQLANKNIKSESIIDKQVLDNLENIEENEPDNTSHLRGE